MIQLPPDCKITAASSLRYHSCVSTRVHAQIPVYEIEMCGNAAPCKLCMLRVGCEGGEAVHGPAFHLIAKYACNWPQDFLFLLGIAFHLPSMGMQCYPPLCQLSSNLLHGHTFSKVVNLLRHNSTRHWPPLACFGFLEFLAPYSNTCHTCSCAL